MGVSMADMDRDVDSDDSDKELQVAFNEGLLKPGLNVEEPRKRTFINNTEGLKQALENIKSDLPWPERLDLTLDPAPAPKPLEELQQLGASSGEDIHDDFKREMLFYRLAQAAVTEGLPKLKKAGIPTRRPDDYYAEMVKTDDHMKKVREKLVEKQLSMERSEKAKKLRELRKFGKKVQVEVIQKRQKEKREMMDAVKRYRKGKEASLDFLDDDMPTQKKGTNAHQNKQTFQPNKRRQAKDKKFGFGGQKKRSKHNTKASTNDMSDFSSKKHTTRPGKKGKKQRPGKKRRQTNKNKKRK